MISFTLNNKTVEYNSLEDRSLLDFLRKDKGITSVKDGCSKQATCGACMVEINGKAKLACVTKMKKLNNAEIYTMEGFPEYVRDVIANAFVNKGAVQCGFCTPGFITRTKVLIQEKPLPSNDEIKKALKLNLCRCTGYKKIEEAIEFSANIINENKNLEINKTSGKIGISHPKYKAYETAIGKRDFVNDISFDGMLYGVLKFSEHPRAIIIKIDISEALKLDGVIKIFTALDIPGKIKTGLIFRDWPLMIAQGETTNYIGDVLAGIVATDEDIARKAVELINVEYELLSPITDTYEAMKIDSPQIHKERPNNFENCVIKKANPKKAFKEAKYIAKGKFQTQRIEHGFLEFEVAIAKPNEIGGIDILSQGQGVYEDRRQVASILNLSEDKVRVSLIPNGGGFGGKEDITVQGHAGLFAYILQKPVKVLLTRDESIRMHPKRHPVYMDMELAANEQGKLTAIKLRAVGDTGAYASVGNKVLERVAGHATAGYYIPNTDIEAKTVYTNNIPSGAMRGFGANQVSFAIESCIDEICEKGNFDRWEFRYNNALVDGLTTATGQKVYGVGIRACLDELKEEYSKAKYSGLACAIKNSGVGNGMADFSNVTIEIKSETHILLQHGWTEMGQGVHNMAIQTFCQETDIKPEFIEVDVDTKAQIKTGMTTSSRATALLGNAIIHASKELIKDLETKTLKNLIGKKYKGEYICDWTTKPGDDVEKIITHYSYGYAAQLCVLDNNGNIDTIYAAHDAGKIMNPMLFEGQIEGAVHMGLGYALSENLPMKDGYLVSSKLKDCKILRAHQTPKIVVKGVEVKDPVGPYGAKGIGEIGLVPTASAVVNALYQFDGIRRYKLPINIGAVSCWLI